MRTMAACASTRHARQVLADADAGMLVSIGLNSQRNAGGASGFRSNISWSARRRGVEQDHAFGLAGRSPDSCATRAPSARQVEKRRPGRQRPGLEGSRRVRPSQQRRGLPSNRDHERASSRRPPDHKADNAERDPSKTLRRYSIDTFSGVRPLGQPLPEHRSV